MNCHWLKAFKDALTKAQEKILNIGVLPTDSKLIKIGKRFYNKVLLYSFIMLFILPPAFSLILKRIDLVLLYNFIVWTIFLIDYKLNSLNRFELSVNFSLISVSIVSVVISFLVLKKQQFSYSFYWAVKLFLLMLIFLALQLKNMLRVRVIYSIVALIVLFFVMDLILISPIFRESTKIHGREIIYFDVFMFIQLAVFYVVSQEYIKTKEYYEKVIEEQMFKLEQLYRQLNAKTQVLSQNLNKASKFYSFLMTVPPEINKFFSRYYILHHPVMYLSGDFYFFKTVGDRIYIILADSIGHGVAAAMLNIYAIALLEYGNIEFQSPAALLEKMKQMLRSYKQIPIDIDVAFDIAIMSYNCKTHELRYVSAELPCWVLHNGQLLKLETYRIQIAQDTREVEFKEHSIFLNKGDRIYLFTDGLQHLYKILAMQRHIQRNFRKFLYRVAKKDLALQQRFFKIILRRQPKFRVPMDDITVLAFEI